MFRLLPLRIDWGGKWTKGPRFTQGDIKTWIEADAAAAAEALRKFCESAQRLQ